MATELDALPSTEELLAGPDVHVKRALTLLGMLPAAGQLEPEAALRVAEYAAAVASSLTSALAALEQTTRGLQTFRALLDAGGLEYAPRGTIRRDRALLEQCLVFLRVTRDPQRDLENLIDALIERLNG